MILTVLAVQFSHFNLNNLIMSLLSLAFSTGISMHKGYAFVQFTNPFDARNACHGEDGRTILSQLLGKYDFDYKFNI